MFRKIFLFEIQNRVRRPAIYLYFAAALIFTIVSFATGSLPVGEKEHINSPYLIAMWCAGITMMMMLVSSSVMGVAMYRDIEYNTKDYYLTYPITKAGYFWGRYLGSFFCMLLVSSAILIGIYIGSRLGPAMGWRDPKEYGPNNLSYYLWPFFTIALPNILFTSSLFFGLVAITRNVKVIYSGGILLFLGYFLAIFFLNNTTNTTVINLADTFALNGVRLASSGATSLQKNTGHFPVEGQFLLNRIIWGGLGLVILLYTYLRFNFETFFSGKRDKSAIDEPLTAGKRSIIRNVKVAFTPRHDRSTLFTLVRMELTNIIRDNYFWIILLSGMVFLGFVFWIGNADFGVPYFPQTVILFNIFTDVFPFFIFFIILFYTGETLHRDRITRYAFINDSLPPPNWVLNGSKLISLLILGASLAFIPVVLGLATQLAKGFFHFNFPVYAIYLFIVILPRLLEMVLFSYMIHVVINNKFAAHAVGVVFWVGVFFLQTTGIFDYNLLLYSYTPGFRITDMDGLGHMTRSVNWFNLYWLIFGGLLAIVAALFYYRGVSSSFRERWQLVGERFDAKTRIFTGVLLVAFLGLGGYIYYNVSYLKDFLTKSERENRAVTYEKTLKRYQSLSLPKISGVKLYADLYPDKQQAIIRGFVTITNKTTSPITQLLLDAEDLTEYSVSQDGKLLPYTSPLLYPRGKFNWFRPAQDTAEFRLYHFPAPLLPGDSAILEINSAIIQKGFSNGLYAEKMLRNGTFFTGGLPGFGYDDDDEINSPYVRKNSGLPPKPDDDEIPQNDPEGIRTLKAGKIADLVHFDVTVSTAGDQTVVAPGELQQQWQQNGRNYFHYVRTQPGLYQPVAMVSARYRKVHDTVQLMDHSVNIDIYYHPGHDANIGRFMAAYKDGLRYFTSVYGEYPLKDIRLAETPDYGPGQASMTSLDTYAEKFAWNADFTSANQYDYCYFTTIHQLAQQWWRFQVAPNETAGSLMIPEGLASYGAIMMAEKKYGGHNIKSILQDHLWFYLFIRRRMEEAEHPLLTADKWFEWEGKAGVALYGLRDLIGEDSLNAALREFKNTYAFRKDPPFAGAGDLYHCLQRHVPDSLQYYLTDTWEKLTLYDNKITDARAVPTGRPDEYRVTLTVQVAKVWVDPKGNDVEAKNMNDYIDIGIFAANSTTKDGRSVVNPLFFKKYKLSAGVHSFTVLVKGKPVSAGIDPDAKLVDRQPNDNMKGL
jgi:ABC-2 type transport system permease protein